MAGPTGAKHNLNTRDAAGGSAPTILTSLQGKSDQSASMSEATTPSPTSTGSSVASGNGVNLSSSDVDNASESLDDLNKTSSGECTGVPCLDLEFTSEI